jgi:hypothetical protein
MGVGLHTVTRTAAVMQTLVVGVILSSIISCTICVCSQKRRGATTRVYGTVVKSESDEKGPVVERKTYGGTSHPGHSSDALKLMITLGL